MSIAEQLECRIHLNSAENQLDFLFDSLEYMMGEYLGCNFLNKTLEKRGVDGVLMTLESLNLPITNEDTETLEMVFSTEGIIQDIKDGITKILKAIWEGIKKVYRFIFRIEKDTEFLESVDKIWMEKIKDNKYKLPSKSEHESIMRGFVDFGKLLSEAMGSVTSSPSSTDNKMIEISVTETGKDGKPSKVNMKWSNTAIKYLKEMKLKPKDEAFYETQTDISLLKSISASIIGGGGDGGIETVSFTDYDAKPLDDLGYHDREMIKKTLDNMTEVSKRYASLSGDKLDSMLKKAIKEVGIVDNPRLVSFMVRQISDAMKLVAKHYNGYHTVFYNTFRGIFNATKKKDEKDI